MDPRRIAFWLLAVAGVAVGHLAGYAVAHPDAAAREAALGGHAYLPVAASVLVPVGVVAALVWAIRTSRELGLAGTIQVRHLAAAQIALFLLQEVGERGVGGIPVTGALTERGVWIGLAAQLLVAWASTRAVAWVRRTVRSIRPGARVLPRLLVPQLPTIVPAVLRSSLATVRVGSRAPPRSVVFR